MSASITGAFMITFHSKARIFLYKGSISMRKSFEGLSEAIEQSFSEKVTSGAYFVFLNRQHDHMKVFYWDGDGLAIWYKRLEKGQFNKKTDVNSCISRREFFMLLEGITPKKIALRYEL